MVEFDKNCNTEYGHDILTLFDRNGQTLAVRSGSNQSNWKNNLRVNGDEVKWTFSTLSKNKLWGWRFIVHPQTTCSTIDLTSFSDCTALAVPSLEFAKSLLGKSV